jgi:hypothetical protein
MVVTLPALRGAEALPQHHLFDHEDYADIEVHNLVQFAYAPPVAPSLRCITFLTVLFFSIYLVVIFVRTFRRVAICTHAILLPLLVTAADALDLVPMLCILMINARQRATQLNPAVGDPQPWAQSLMYACVAALMLRLLMIVAKEAVAAGKGEDVNKRRAGRMVTSRGNESPQDKEHEEEREDSRSLSSSLLESVQQSWGPTCPQELSLLDKALIAGHALSSLSLYGCCVGIVVALFVMKRPEAMNSPPLTPMMLCSTILTVLYLTQYSFLEIYSGFCNAKPTSREQDSPVLLAGDFRNADTGIIPRRRRHEDEAYIRVEPVTLQFIPMFCVLLVGIGLRAVQLNLLPDKWACVAMFVTTVAIVVQALAIPIFKYFLSPGDGQEDTACFPYARKPEDEALRLLPMKILTIGWSLLMACLYVGIAGTLVTIFAMEAEPLDMVWPEKQMGLLEAFLVHLEKSRHLMENEALHALSTASIPPISTAMRCTMLLTVLYFGVFLGVLVGRATCGPAHKQAACVGEAEDELQTVVQQLQEAQQGHNEREARSPEQDDVLGEQESSKLKQLEEQVKSAKERVLEERNELLRAQDAENIVRDGIQRSLAFVPMLCVLMIAVRMRAMQLHIRDPQPWAQITMYVASSAVTIQVLASVLWACCVRADDVALSCGEVGLFGKVAAIMILAVRYIAALSLYIAMICLVVALISMQQGMSLPN